MESKSTNIYNFLEEKITKGEYKPGERLPSESELCSEFGVSRGPVRAALDQLMAIGLIFKKKGGGSFVSKQDSADFLNVMLPRLRFNTKDYREMLEMRCALDKLSIELCLENHETNNYEKLDAVMNAMSKDPDIDDFFNLDKKFHTILSSLSGNGLLHNINILVWDLLQHCPREEYYAYGKVERIREHRDIYNCIKNNDPELAIIYSLRHLRKVMNQDKKKQDPARDNHRWNPWLYDTL